MENSSDCGETVVEKISEFYRGRDIFITGATGFIGKVLIEKLLRSCPSLNRIYILMREKKGKTGVERVKTLTDNPLFQSLKTTSPECFDKISILLGDVSQLRLGLSAEDVQRLHSVSIIFHAAASVRFDDPLQSAILLNTRGTREVMELALHLRQLKSLVYVSTTYSNPDHLHVEEKLYPSHGDWRYMIRIAESFDPAQLDSLSQKTMDYFPNTYSYSKGLAEQICSDYKDRLPIVLFRPSIVTNICAEPIPGWIDNFNGPCGLLASSAVGLLRTMHLPTRKEYINYIPADTCVKGMIVSSWVMGTSTRREAMPIYNCTALILPLEKLIETSRKATETIPPSQMIWLPGGILTCSALYFFFRKIFYELLPAILLDTLFRLTNRKPFLLKLQRLCVNALTSLYYFISREWEFSTQNYDMLDHLLLESDKHEFRMNLQDLNFDKYIYYCTLGARRFLLKGKDEDLPTDVAKYKRFKLVDAIIKYLKYALIVYILYIVIF